MKKKLLVDRRFCHIAKKKWGRVYDILPSAHVQTLPEPVCCHPDMSLLAVGDTYIAEKTVYPYYKNLLSGKTVISGQTALGSHYPYDVAYNVLISGKLAFANFQYTDCVVKQELKKQNFQLINIRQGYANCSAAKIGDCLITADPSILAACANCGVEALEIAPGDVALIGYAYGFIGGASGFVDGKLMFFGDIEKHQNYKKIKQFADKKRIPIDDIKGLFLTDVGTIIGIDGE